MPRYRLINAIYYDGQPYAAGSIIDTDEIPGLSGESLVHNRWADEYHGDEPTTVQSNPIVAMDPPPAPVVDLATDPDPVAALATRPIPTDPVVDLAKDPTPDATPDVTPDVAALATRPTPELDPVAALATRPTPEPTPEAPAPSKPKRRK